MSDLATAALVGIEKVASLDYLEQVFDCYRDGRVAVPLDAGVTSLPGRAFDDRVTPKRDSGWFDRRQAPRDDAAPAQISFSSGTTGEPKAIVLSHRALRDVTHRLIAVMRIDADIAEYLAVPPTYSFGLARARVVAAVGGRLYVPPHGFDPGEFARMLDDGQVNALAAVPTILRVLVANPDLIGADARRKLRWLEIGSQPMSADEKRAIRDLFPNARIVQHYGLTEASRTTFLVVSEADDAELESVGMPTGDAAVRIDDEGRICIRGPHVADGLLTATGVERLVDAHGWLRTNDLGHIDDRGTLHFLGRSDSLLNVGGIKVPAELFEERLAAHPATRDASFAVTGLRDPLRGEIVMVGHLPFVGSRALVQATRDVAAGFGLGAADVRLIEIADIPRTETGKVRRTELAKLGARAMAAVSVTEPARPAETATDMTADERAVAKIWGDALNLRDIRRDDTFFDLGGDSLAAINVMLNMERAGVSPDLTRQIFEGRSVAEIAAAMAGGEGPGPAASPRAQTNDAILLTRGLMVLVVIAGHWLPFLILRMGSLADPLLKAAIPFFRLGTPGFAIVFGLGLTFYNLGMLRRHPDRLRANMWRGALTVGAGVAALAAMRWISYSLEGAPVNPSTLFFGVLLAYFCLVLLSIPLLKIVDATRNPGWAALILGLAALFASGVLHEHWQPAESTGFLDLLRLMSTAKYGLLQMIGYVGLGMAIGVWFETNQDRPGLARESMLAGVALFLTAGVLTVTLGLEPLWFEGSLHSMMLIADCGFILLVAGGSLAFVRSDRANGLLRVPMRVLMMIGILAFAAFVGHSLAMSLRISLASAPIPAAVAIALPVGGFFFAMAYGVRRLYRLHYGR